MFDNETVVKSPYIARGSTKVHLTRPPTLYFTDYS